MISNVSGSTSYIFSAGFPPFSTVVSYDLLEPTTNDELVGVSAGAIDANAIAMAAFCLL